MAEKTHFSRSLTSRGDYLHKDQVCEEQHCEDEVFVLAASYVDRYMSIVPTLKSKLQLLGCACLFIASKLKEAVPFTADKLVAYTAHSVTISELMESELGVLQTLKWNISVATPYDFLDQIFVRLSSLDSSQVGKLRRHCQTFIALCATDFSFASYPASMVAGGSVIAAANGILGRSSIESFQLVTQLQRITSIDADCLQSCHEQIERLLASSASSSASEAELCSALPESLTGAGASRGAPTTPTDAVDVMLAH